MKLAFVIGAATGYVLGARAGRARYDQIVKLTHKVTGSQTVQSTAGVLQAQASELAGKAKVKVGAHLPGVLGQTFIKYMPGATPDTEGMPTTNGHRAAY
jgi:hypothetical protein